MVQGSPSMLKPRLKRLRQGYLEQLFLLLLQIGYNPGGHPELKTEVDNMSPSRTQKQLAKFEITLLHKIIRNGPKNGLYITKLKYFFEVLRRKAMAS